MGRSLQSIGRVRRGAQLALTLLAVSFGGCTDPLLFDNVVPVITALGPVVQDGPDRVRISLWLQDWERDPVDVELVYIEAGKAPKPLVQALGGHGDAGLTSEKDWPGMEHVFVWDTSGLPPTAKLRLRVTPDDARAGEGDALETPEFELGVGLPTPVVP